MRAKAPVRASANMVKHPSWNVGHIDKGNWRWPARERWLRRGGNASSGSGASGWKLRRSAVLARSLADRPGVAALVKARQQEREAERGKQI